MTRPLRLLIDGDVILYQHMLGLEHEVEWSPDIWTLHCDISEAKDSINQWIEKLLVNFDAARYTFCLSCPTEDGFRYQLNPDYKSNRKGKRKPLGFRAMRTWVKEQFGAVSQPRLEADDIIGILATCPKRNEAEEQIVVSIDKDFRSVPCQFYRFSDTNPDIEVISPEAAELNHAIQTLAGDAVDGYSGCPGTGVITARRALEGLTGVDLWAKVLEFYEKKGLTRDAALMNARMAYILQSHNYKKGRIKLWEFPIN